MTASNAFQPLVELTRGPLVESIHFGALTVVDADGNLVASVGDADLFANLRSSSKPFQALPLYEDGGADHFGMTEREIAITCASHHGTDDHVQVLRGLQAKFDVREQDLQCGVHPAGDEATAKAMLLRGEAPTPIRHNCSGKHTGMLGQCRLSGQPIETYLSNDHPVQVRIKRTFAELAGMDPEQVLVGIDGCSAPTFAVPLHSAALAYARLCDPSGLPEKRAAALRRIFHAMTSNPDMVAGPDAFDTRLMEVSAGKIVCKGGAEGYQAMGIAPDAIAPGSPAMGITYKVIDGDTSGRARPVIGLTVLHMLGALNDAQMAALAEFGPRPIYNWRHLEVGVIRPAFSLENVLSV
ncbi:MAG TPA: asparaginase [Anaerolineaceae bacterium]